MMTGRRRQVTRIGERRLPGGSADDASRTDSLGKEGRSLTGQHATSPPGVLPVMLVARCGWPAWPGRRRETGSANWGPLEALATFYG
jgi:hypothetical protein